MSKSQIRVSLGVLMASAVFLYLVYALASSNNRNAPPPTNVAVTEHNDIECRDIVDSRKSMTSIQWKDYTSSLIDKRIYWKMQVRDVDKGWFTEDFVIGMKHEDGCTINLTVPVAQKSFALSFAKGETIYIKTGIEEVVSIAGSIVIIALNDTNVFKQ